MVRLALIGVVAASLLCASAGSESASADANLTLSTPADGAILLASPNEIVFVFSEPVVVEQSIVQVADPTGAQRDNGDFHHHGDATNPGITVPPGLPQGEYTVTWEVPSATDGHRTSGTFAFTVATSPLPTGISTPSAPSTEVEPDESGSSALVFVLAAIVAGALGVGAMGVVLLRRRG